MQGSFVRFAGAETGYQSGMCSCHVIANFAEVYDLLQHDLRESFAALFNRQEVIDLLDHLLKEGRITRVVPKDIAVSEKYIDLLDVKYEPLISYLPEVLW